MTIEHILYLAAIAVIIPLEHRLFARAWKNYELARRVMGIATVMGLALPLALTGHLDWTTWLYLMAAFCLAGAITATMYTSEKAAADQHRASSLRSAIHGRQKD